MNALPCYHLVYVPGEPALHYQDKIIDLFRASTKDEVLLRTASHPGAITLQLEAQHPSELSEELRLLGF